MEEYEDANCPECNSEKWKPKTAQIEDYNYLTPEETGTVGGEYHVDISVECEEGHTFSTTVRFFPASCSNPEKGCHDEKTKVIESKTEYLKDPDGFYNPGHGWLIIDKCVKCGKEERHSCTVRGILLGRLKSA
jgi:hypothetical protein